MVTQAAVVDAVPRQLWIDGVWRDATSGATFPVHDPATGRVLAQVADATPADGLAALEAAVAAQAEWAAYPPRERGEILRRGYQAIIDATDELALLMTLEMGKPLAESRAEVAYGAEFLRWFSEEAVRVRGSWSPSPDGRLRMLTMRQPVGPTLMVTPWNFPLAMGTRKIGPAVAAGCTMVLKPAEQTPLTTLRLAHLLHECGLPSGVLNVVTTSDPGPLVSAILHDQRLRKLTFTGSTEVGRLLAEQAARHTIRVSLELGGNAPLLVFDDADLDVAVEGALAAKMRNIGQACVAANRILVHEAVAAEFTRRLTDRMAALSVGKGTAKATEVGPLIDADAVAKVTELVAEARATGATLHTGGNAPAGRGHFFAPTVLSDVPDSSRIAREEIFGPVAAVSSFASEQEAVRRANDTAYGLMAYVFTRDLSRAIRVSEALQSGMVAVNSGVVSNPAAPFGGVKASGLGREGGAEGIEEFLEVKYVGIAP